jgi:hypothetical protein
VTPLGTFSIRWTKNGAEYLRWAEATFERAQRRLGFSPMMVANGVEARSCYKGRCFEVLPALQRFDTYVREPCVCVKVFVRCKASSTQVIQNVTALYFSTTLGKRCGMLKECPGT